MSKVFRRPMFRKGGNVGQGIMTGIRDNYENGGAADRIRKAMESVPTQSFDPLTQFLIQGGLNLVSQPSTGGVLSDIATAAKEPTAQLFQGLSERDRLAREIAVAGAELDIEQDLKSQEMQQKADLALLERQFLGAEGDKDRQNKIAVEIEKRKTELAKIQEKSKFPDVSKTEQVRPAFENVVSKLSEMYSDSKNPAVKLSPDLTAFNVTKFRREASPEIISKFKGFKPYTFDNKGNVAEMPLTGYEPGDIIYDPKTADFLVFDNQGNTYRLEQIDVRSTREVDTMGVLDPIRS